MMSEINNIIVCKKLQENILIMNIKKTKKQTELQ